MSLITDIAKPDVVTGIGVVGISDHEPVPRYPQSHQPVGDCDWGGRIAAGAGDSEGTAAIVQIVAGKAFQIRTARLVKPAARRVERNTHHLHVRLDSDGIALLHRYGIFRAVDGSSTGEECKRGKSGASTQDGVRMGHHDLSHCTI